jgi:uncharacterized membrane protein YuzA (DUF378 family)
MKSLHTVTFILLAVGGANWGLVGLSALIGAGNWNVVNMILGSWPMVENLVYLLVGLSAVYEVVKHKWYCKECTTGAAM